MLPPFQEVASHLTGERGSQGLYHRRELLRSPPLHRLREVRPRRGVSVGAHYRRAETVEVDPFHRAREVQPLSQKEGQERVIRWVSRHP